MNFERPMMLDLSGPEVALVVSALGELPAKHSHDLLRKIEAIDAEMTAQDNKVPAPTLKMVSEA